MENHAFHYASLGELREECASQDVNLHFSDDLAPLAAPLPVGRLTLRNRLAVLPMEGCDARENGAPSELTVRRYDRFARGGAGLIWMEAAAVVPEGRASAHQLWLHEGTRDDFARLRERIDREARAAGFEGPVCILQLTHSGRFSRPEGTPAPVIACHNPWISARKIDDAPLAPITDDALERLEERYEAAAVMAKDAGFDGVDIKSCHRYLVSELLSAYTRKGPFGGSYEGRTKFLRDVVARVGGAAGSGFLVTTRLNLFDAIPRPYGWGVSEGDRMTPDFTEPIRLLAELHTLGVDLAAYTMGCPYLEPNINRPSDVQNIEHPLRGVARMIRGVGEIQKAVPGVAAVGVGFSYLREYAPHLAAGEIGAGALSVAGFGRESLAYPDFARDILQGGLDRRRCCVACGGCAALLRAGRPSGCVVRDKDVYQRGETVV